MRLKSSSIYYALFLSVIISLFLGGMILFSGVNKRYASQLEIQERLIDNAHSGIEYARVNFKEIPADQPLEALLYGKATDSVRIQAKNWGAYKVISSEAHHGRNTYTKIALNGQANKMDDPNLYLVDQGRPFSLCGDTRIEGKCIVPKAGPKRAYIEGKNYQGTKLLYGTATASQRSLPAINMEFVKQINSLKGNFRIWEDRDSMIQSFSDEAIHFIDDNYTSLQNIHLSGQIIIEARDSIFVGATADLDQVILKSQVVYIQSGFVGTLQIYGTERIVLEDDVTLKYPSVLGIVEETFPKERQAQIEIGARSQVIGSVFALSEAPNFRLPIQISIAEESEVDGLVYCQGRLQLKGTVKGSVYAQKFYLETPSSKYENHLLDAKILNKLPEEFVYISLLENENALTQIAWLE